MKSGWLVNRERKRPQRDNACPLLLPLINTLWTPPFGHKTTYRIYDSNWQSIKWENYDNWAHHPHFPMRAWIFNDQPLFGLCCGLWVWFVYRWDSLLNHSEPPHTMPPFRPCPTCAGIKETPLHQWPDIKKARTFPYPNRIESEIGTLHVNRKWKR